MALLGPMFPHKPSVVVPCGRLYDALREDASRAEGRHEGPVLAHEHDEVGVLVVGVVFERGKVELFCVHFALYRPLM
jgi:hypothetical protein